MGNDYKFSLDNFKRWMKDHDEDHTLEKPVAPELIGSMVESKFSAKKILAKMECETDNPEEVARSFAKSGGKIVEVDGKNYLIETDVGSFCIKSCYVIMA